MHARLAYWFEIIPPPELKYIIAFENVHFVFQQSVVTAFMAAKRPAYLKRPPADAVVIELPLPFGP